MPLISSVSGIRGTIGGLPGEGLTPVDVVTYAAAYGKFIGEKREGNVSQRVVIGRDARLSGEQICDLVGNTLNAMGIDTIELGLATTPTVEMAVVAEEAAGGIIITASHNPEEWNALKLLNSNGEFLSATEGQKLESYRKQAQFDFVPLPQTGIRLMKEHYLEYHIDKILALNEVDPALIQKADLSVVIDGINSVGSFAVPALLKKLGVRKVKVINDEPLGKFAHNPEPLPEHLEALSRSVRDGGADLGVVVDPDVDRLAFVCEDGNPFGEEYTLVVIADYILQQAPGDVVSNLSSSNALGMIAEKYGRKRYTSAVGEVNVIQKMKEVNAVIGGEGNGGVIFPPLHYGRDALVGIALFLTFLAKRGEKVSELRKQYPEWYMTKTKVQLSDSTDTGEVFDKIRSAFPEAKTDSTDGLYLSFKNAWIHVRKSNTEPILRIYTESLSKQHAEELSVSVKKIIS